MSTSGVDIDRIHRKRPFTPTEHEIQCAYFDWVRLQYPYCKLIYAVPNGSSKSMPAALKFKREGLTPGMPDVNIDIPRGDYHGMRIEFKSANGFVADTQKIAHQQLNDAGYWVVVCRTTEAAIEATKAYLGEWRWQ